MKVIDLLNKIANGEEVPKKVQWGVHNYTFCGNEYKALDELGKPLLIEQAGHYLNDEIEIIEDKKIKKLDIRNEKNCKNNWKWKVYGEEHSYNISTPQKIIADKINEIIDYLEENK